MRKYYLLFTAFECILINYLLTNPQNWIVLAVTFLYILRVQTLGIKKLKYFLIIFGIIWYGFQSNYNYKIFQKDNFNNQNQITNITVRVFPDQIDQINRIYKFIGTKIDNGEKVQVSYQPLHSDDLAKITKSKKAKVIEIQGKETQPELPTNENQFNYRNYLLSKNIRQIIYAKKCYVKNISDESIFDKILEYFHSLRQNLAEYFTSLPTCLRNYCNALILGKITDDFHDTSENIKHLGLLYLFCLSGMHVFFIKKYFNEFLELFCITQETINLVLLCILPVYCILGGNNLSLSRAIWMIWVGIFSSFILKNQFSGIECWSITVIIYLILYPAMFLSLGAKLSYLLTFILLCQRDQNNFMLSFKLNNYSVPLILNSTFQWNILTVFYSVIIGELFEKVIFPATLIGATCIWFNSLCNWLLKICDSIFNQLAQLNTIITFGKLPMIFCIIILILFFQLENNVHKKIKWMLIILIYTGNYAYIHFPLSSEVVYFDIGQGDSTLIRTKFNQDVVLIDTGGKVNFGKQKQTKGTTMGESVIANYLLSKGIDQIDGLYLTHQDTDHVGYFPSIGREIHYKKIYVPAGMENLVNFQARLAQIHSQRPIVVPLTNQISAENGLQILHPFNAGKGTNKDSLVLLKKINDFTFLFTGDLDQEGELQVLEHYPMLRTDFFKVGHHGSKTATNPNFVSHLHPKFAIISAGRHNRFHHPNQETLQTLNQYQIPYLLTAKDGMIKISVYRNRYQITNGGNAFGCTRSDSKDKR